MPLTEPLPPRRRFAVLDGLRGVAIILVVLSHGWTLWPTDRILDTPVVRDLFLSGDFAVSVFFVVGSFLTTRALLARPEGQMLPGVNLLRRILRTGGQMYALLLVVLVVAAVDTTDTYAQNATGHSVLRAATFTWNWYVRSDTLQARPDLGHLWYLSVDLQVFLLVVCIAWLLRRRRGWLAVALGALLLSFLAWRAHVYGVEGEFSALVRTSSRGDAPLTGAFAAAALPFLGRLRPYAGRMAVVGTLALVPLLWAVSDIRRYFGLSGILLDLALAAVVVGTALGPAPRTFSAVVGSRWLSFLGRHSLSVYLWHYPVFWFVARHSAGWHWETRTLLAFGITALGALASELLVERRVQATLDSPKWRRLDDGIAPAVVAAARGLRSRRPTASGGAGPLA